METKSKIGEQFLRSFIIEVINNSQLNLSKNYQTQYPSMQEIEIPEKKLTPLPMTRVYHREFERNNSSKRNFNQIQLQRKINYPQRQSHLIIPKLNFIIKDPAVTEIECRGADKPILVKKAGTIQRTQTSLTIEEINQILNDFSEKTKIPIIEGTFKAASGNLIMTAIISEILGPRFIIQKKNPFRQLMP
ncbi:MAG: hypothetical protein Q8P57_01185 [Candidatus Pacearchaeota archaeon]|nr:hypothetical protein [Candidatus Pacearchaeota archaeon]